MSLILSFIFFVSISSAITVQSYSLTNQDSQNNFFEPGDELQFRLNASTSREAELTLSNPNSDEVINRQMNKSKQGDYQIYTENYTVPNSPSSGEWNYRISIDGGNEIIEDRFQLSNSAPKFYSYSVSPQMVQKGKNLTITADIMDAEEDIQNVTVNFTEPSKDFSLNLDNSRDNLLSYSGVIETWKSGEYEYDLVAEDSSGRSSKVEDGFNAFGAKDAAKVKVEIAPSCSTSLDYFLVPGDGEIVQNKTGVFVEILSNSGNVEADINVEQLRVTYEEDDPWSFGESIGPEVKSYSGERFENVDIGESVTYFKLFKASYQLGNYTGRSTVSAECSAKGPQNKEEDKNELNQSYTCSDINDTEFSCYNRTVVKQSQVARETTTVNITEPSSKSFENQVSTSQVYKGNLTLNDTLYDVYTVNSSQTSGYDYACISFNSTVEEDEECAYESSTTSKQNIKVQELGFKGQNGTFAQMRNNNDYMNTSLNCLNDNGTYCNYTYTFEKSFSFFGNFEIVTAIGDQRGGANESGNSTSNRSIPGDNQEPGQTEVPRPQPQPTPQPDPRPQISVEINPVQKSHTTRQGIYKAVTFEATNEGNESLDDVELVPQVGSFPESWEVRNSRIENLSAGETVERDVFVSPDNSTAPGDYVVPVAARYEGRQLDLEYFNLKVLRSTFIPQIRIGEVPTSFDVRMEQERSAPILIENVGRRAVEDVTAELQNIEDCGSFSSDTVPEIDVNNSKSMEIEIEAGESTGNCEATLVVSSKDGAYAFSDIDVTVLPERGLVPEKQRVPIVAVLWTAILLSYAVFTKRYHLETLAVKIPFIMLIVGEVLILLFVVSNYYALPMAQLLPF